MVTGSLRHAEDEESYFVSMTDLMIGLLFIFIIMLMFFALQYRKAEQLRTTAVDQLTHVEKVREKILNDIQRSLADRGIKVEIDPAQGILRLPEAILFDKAKADINDRGNAAIAHVAESLSHVLPCYTAHPTPKSAQCPEDSATIESLYIEGHTDIDRLIPQQGMKDNFDLSAIRATNAYRLLVEKKPVLLEFKNESGFPVLSVSGYGQFRPVGTDKAANRRIDIRIIMSTPTSDDIRKIPHTDILKAALVTR